MRSAETALGIIHDRGKSAVLEDTRGRVLRNGACPVRGGLRLASALSSVAWDGGKA